MCKCKGKSSFLPATDFCQSEWTHKPKSGTCICEV